jgi:hypothetical protein
VEYIGGLATGLRALRVCRRLPPDQRLGQPDVIGIDLGTTLLSA